MLPMMFSFFTTVPITIDPWKLSSAGQVQVALYFILSHQLLACELDRRMTAVKSPFVARATPNYAAALSGW